MQIFKTIDEQVAFLQSNVWGKKSLGFVPTMGALHEGHLSLIRKSLKTTELTIVSIFVNPAQFNNVDDLKKYPIQIEQDLDLLQKEGCHIVFMPSSMEMYPSENSISIDFGDLDKSMEGQFRPGHFSGVGLVVGKFFNIIRPSLAYFGQKDLQQVAVIKKLVRDFNFGIDVEVGETIREPNGLAMSSRNQRLSVDGKELAACIYSLLMKFKNRVLSGETIGAALKSVSEEFKTVSGIKLEYLKVVDSNTVQPVSVLEDADEISICVAAVVEGVRILDNVYLKKH